MIGEIVSHYKVIDKIGGGGMGQIFKAQDLILDRFVALKFLPSIFSMNEDFKQSIIEEAKIAATLDHPNICNIHEVGETDDEQIFIAMSYYEGETLRRKIQNNSVPKDDIESIILQIAKGLKQAHDKGIVHRDIKPENIFITKENVVKILDFGVAKIAGDYSVMDAEKVKGTIAYMSPEQISGEATDNRTDIWAFGVLLYELITGEKPFSSQYEQSALYSIMNDEPDYSRFSELITQSYLKEIVQKCLEKKKEDRSETAHEIVQLLDNKTTYGISNKYKSFTLILIALLLVFILFILNVNKYTDHSNFSSTANLSERIVVLPCQNLIPNEENFVGISEVVQSIIVSKLTGVKELAVFDHLSLNESINSRFGSVIPRENSQLVDFLANKEVDYFIDSKLLKVGTKFQLEINLIKTEGLEIIFTRNKIFSDNSEIQNLTQDIATDILDYFQIKYKFTMHAADLKPWLENGSKNLNSLKAFLTASQYNFSGEKELTEKYLRRAIMLDSNFISPRIWLITTLKWINNIDSAKIEFEKLKKLELGASPFEQAMIEWVSCYLNEDYINEIKHLKIALQFAPMNNMILFNLGRTFFIIGDYAKSVEALSQCVQSGWKFSQAYFLLGSSYERLGDLQKSKEIFERALHLKPIYPDIYNILSRVYLLEDDTLNGRKNERLYINKVKEVGWDLGNVYSYLAKQNYALDYFNKSIEYYKKAIKIDDENSTYHSGLGASLLEIHDTNSALNELRIALNLDKYNYEANFNLGLINEAKKKFHDAIRYFNNCIAIDSVNSENQLILEKLSQLHAKKKNNN